MLFSYTGNNPLFLEQSFFDLDGELSIDVSSVSPTEVVIRNTAFADANVTVTLRGTEFEANVFGLFTAGEITSIEFDGLGIRQGTVSEIAWEATAFQSALLQAANNSDFAALGALFNSSGPITIDASAALSGFDQEFAWGPFLPFLTQPITVIDSAFDDAFAGGTGNDVFTLGSNDDQGDRVAATQGNDRIVFDIPDGETASGFTLDYDRFSAPVTFNINGLTNTATVQGPGFTDTLENVNDALSWYLGLEGTNGDDVYSVQLAPGQIVALIGGSGADSYSIAADGATPILDFLFSNATSGLDIDLSTGVVLDDGFGFRETFEITGTPTRTFILATTNDDRVVDGSGSSLVRLYDGDDLFVADGTDRDSIDAGSGTDTIVFSDLEQGNATISFSGLISTVFDRDNPTKGTSLIDFEFIETAGGVQLEISKHDGIGLISADDLTTLTELYIAYFDRAADALGLSFWATAYAKNGFSFEEIADLFFTQPETVALYSGVSDGEFVTAVYNNVLGRDPDQAGFEFWTTQLAQGGTTESGFILDLLAGARAATGSPDDVAYIESKTDIGLYFAVWQGQSNLSAANEVMDAFDGTLGGLATAIDLADDALADAQAGSTELLLPVVGVIDNPFPELV